MTMMRLLLPWSTETIDAFSSQVIHAKMRVAHRGDGINVMTQALCIEDGSLLQGLMVQKAYTELYSGSKNITVVVRNSTGISLRLCRKKIPVARAVMVTQIPELPVQISLMEVSEKDHGSPDAQVNCESKARRSCLRSWI